MTRLSPRQIKAVRNWLGMSQPEFARRCSVSLTSIVDLEKSRRPMGEDVMTAISAYLATIKVQIKGDSVVLGP